MTTAPHQSQLREAATPAKPWVLNHLSLSQRVPVGSCFTPWSEPKNLPSREGSGCAQSSPLLLHHRSSPKQGQFPWSFLIHMFSGAQISLFRGLLSTDDDKLMHIFATQTQNQLLHASWILCIYMYFLPFSGDLLLCWIPRISHRRCHHLCYSFPLGHCHRKNTSAY